MNREPVAAFEIADHQQPRLRTFLEHQIECVDDIGNALMLLNQPCCAGLAVKIQHEVTAALRPTCDELVQQLLVQTQLAMNESPTKKGSAEAWQNRSNNCNGVGPTKCTGANRHQTKRSTSSCAQRRQR